MKVTTAGSNRTQHRPAVLQHNTPVHVLFPTLQHCISALHLRLHKCLCSSLSGVPGELSLRGLNSTYILLTSKFVSLALWPGSRGQLHTLTPPAQQGHGACLHTHSRPAPLPFPCPAAPAKHPGVATAFFFNFNPSVSSMDSSSKTYPGSIQIYFCLFPSHPPPLPG